MKKDSIVKRSLYSWVFSSKISLQLILLGIAVGLVVVRVLPLEMQKRIVNDAITFKKTDLLIYYCLIYLLSVVAASGLKYLSVILQTKISQQALADMRKALYDHIISLPLSFFRKTQPGMVVNSLVSELAVPSNFVGMAFAVPVINILTLLAFAGYLFFLSPLLAAISLSIYPAVLFLIPKLQKHANKANKDRVDTSRVLSAKIAESIGGIHEIHGSGSYTLENRKLAGIIDKLFRIRVKWTLFREGVKVTNNFFTSLGPFLVFILGGYLVIINRLDLGALVAFLSAQEKLYTPWKELIDFYQVNQNAQVAYARTMQYFDVPVEFELTSIDRKPYDLSPGLEVKNLSFETEDGIQLLNGVDFSLDPGEHLALIGFSGSGKSTLAQCIGQLYKYTGGHVFIGDKEVSALSKQDIVRNIGYIPQTPFIFDGSIEENLLYSCEVISADTPEESCISANLDDLIRILQQTGIYVDVLRFGLNTILNPDEHREFIQHIIKARTNFQNNFGAELSEYVEFFNEDEFLHHSSIAENLTFGSPNNVKFAQDNLLTNDKFLSFLDQADLNRPLLALGAELTLHTVDILGNLPPEPIFFQQSPINPEELDFFKGLSKRLKKTKLHQIKEEDKEQLLTLALRFTPGRHKMVALPAMLEKLILEGRALFREQIIETAPESFTFFNMREYIPSQTILNNIFFGKITSAAPQAQDRINQCVMQLLIEEDLLDAVLELGMKFNVGSKGENLSGGQRQKLAIARAFLKNPKFLVMDESTSALDNKSQARIQNLLETRWKGKTTLISVVHRLDIIKNYDKIAVMKAGKIMEFGPYDQLYAKKGMLYELISGKK